MNMRDARWSAARSPPRRWSLAVCVGRRPVGHATGTTGRGAMPLRHLFVTGAVPVSDELEGDALRWPFVHQLLRWDSIVSTVFGHLRTAADDATDSRTGGKAGDPAVKVSEDAPQPMSRPVRKFSEPPVLRAQTSSTDTEDGKLGSVSAHPALFSSLQLRLGYLQHVRRLSRRENRAAASAPPPAPVPSRRVSAPCRPSALAARLRKISVTDTLRQVGKDLRRIADHLQLSKLVGGRSVSGASRDISWMYPVVTMGCVLVCGITAVLGRACRH
ncbi:uncharacterized protein LOC122374997 [Amphibalanus amphitrite]|uniref:uncharacterized protein LOC122374997 n=1 Tax=Amphibalanus amphitrite TaxID=1232801 RepID=UPI001C918001|nr:uncharacterized protein LOC122374997 [Amphibalanus amphitrite]